MTKTWFVITAALPTGSVEAFLLPELRALAAHDVEVVVVPVQPRAKVVHTEARALHARIRPLLSPAIAFGAVAAYVRAPRRATRALAALVTRSRSPAILAKNLAVFPKALWLTTLLRRARADHIHAQFASTPATVAYVAHVITNIPWSVTAHRWDIADNNLLAVKGASASFLRAIDTRGKHLLEHHARARVVVLRVGVDIPAVALVAAPARHALRLVVAARLAEVKGHTYLLDAIARVVAAGHAVHLDVAGDGRLRAALERHARALDLAAHVTFLGTLDHADLLARMARGDWDAAVLPSIENARDWEGIPIALVEAMAAGIPVIATATGGIPELVAPDAGVLVPQRDPAALAHAIIELARDPSARSALGERGRARVRALHEVGAVVRSLLELAG